MTLRRSLVLMLICACCITIHALQSSYRNSLSLTSSSRKIMRLNMQNDNSHINTKPISLISAATIAASLMGLSSANAVEKWSYGNNKDDALTQKLADKVTKQSTSSARPDVRIPIPNPSKSINIQIPDIKVEIPDIKVPPLPDIKVELPSMSDEKINGFKQAASEYAKSITIKNKVRAEPPVDDLLQVYKKPAPYQFPSSSSGGSSSSTVSYTHLTLPTNREV